MQIKNGITLSNLGRVEMYSNKLGALVVVVGAGVVVAAFSAGAVSPN